MTETKTVQVQIPEYLTVQQYMDLQGIPETDSKLEKSLYIISTLTGIEVEELKYWDLDSIKKVNNLIEGMINPGNEFHSLLEWNGTLYGYSNIKQQSLGEYIDLENLSKDINNNLHKILAILYRPVTKHRFDTFSFQLKHHLKVVRGTGVANVFDYYDIEKYDNNTRKSREKDFLGFPVTIGLGAISFFLITGSQYLNSIVYSGNQEKAKKMNQKILTSLIQNIGVGGGLFTHSLKPVYLQLQETPQLQT